MAWQTEIVRLIRHVIGDLDETPTYTDDRLEELVIVSAQFVNKEVSFTQVYETDLDELILTPDPTDRASRDDSFINLITLKAACIIDGVETRRASKQGIVVKDGTSYVDLRGNLQGRLSLLREGACKAYEDTKLQYEMDRQSVAGRAILSPFKTDTMARSETDFR